MDISIVTPVFNSNRWINLCIRLVRHALQGQSYVHIVVDGGRMVERGDFKSLLAKKGLLARMAAQQGIS